MAWILSVLYLLDISSTLGVAANPPADPKNLLKSVENHYRQKKTLSAVFSQEQWIEATGQNKKTEGTLEVLLPGMFRWEVIAPDPSVVVSDAKQVWFYTPPFTKEGRGQVMVKQVGGHQTELLQALLAGNLSRIRAEKLKPFACKDCAAGTTPLELIPKKGTAAGVKSVRVVIHNKDLEIQRVELQHKSGNRSKIALTQIKLGKALTLERFQFQTPPDTDVVKE